MSETWTVIVTVEIDVPEGASEEAREYAAYEAAKDAIGQNTADWWAEAGQR